MQEDERCLWHQNRENEIFATSVCVWLWWCFLFVWGFFSFLFVLVCFQYPVTIFSLTFLVTREGES